MIKNIEFINFEPTIRYLVMGEGKDAVLAVTMGPGSYLISGSLEFGSINCHVLVGAYSSLGHRLKFIVGLNHDGSQVTTYPFRDVMMTDHDDMVNSYFFSNHYQIIIGNDVWIGADVTILGGVHIGNGAIIGAGAVISKDVPPYAVVVGNPAKVVKYRFSNEIIDKLQKIKWWNWSDERIKENLVYLEDMNLFMERFSHLSGKFLSDIENDILIKLQELKDEGYVLYWFIADFSANRPVWKNVLQQYVECFSVKDKSILLFSTIESGMNARYQSLIEEVVPKNKNGLPRIELLDSVKNVIDVFSQKCDYFITSREYISSQVVDFSTCYSMKIISGLDYDIFNKYQKHKYDEDEIILKKKI